MPVKGYYLLRRLFMIGLFIGACYVTFTMVTNLSAKDVIYWFKYMR